MLFIQSSLENTTNATDKISLIQLKSLNYSIIVNTTTTKYIQTSDAKSFLEPVLSLGK